MLVDGRMSPAPSRDPLHETSLPTVDASWLLSPRSTRQVLPQTGPWTRTRTPGCRPQQSHEGKLCGMCPELRLEAVQPSHRTRDH